jgi:hypothetical protein
MGLRHRPLHVPLPRSFGFSYVQGWGLLTLVLLQVSRLSIPKKKALHLIGVFGYIRYTSNEKLRIMPHRRGERVLSRFDGSRWVETRMTVISSIRRSRSGKVVTVCHQRSRLTSLDLSAPLRVAVLRSEREREREGGGACEREQSAHEISTRAFPPLTCFVCPTTFP